MTEITLPVPPADLSELWTRCTNLADLISETQSEIERASHFGHPITTLCQEMATLRVNHEIMVREYNRRTA